MSSLTKITIFSTDPQSQSRLSTLFAISRAPSARGWAQFSGPDLRWQWFQQVMRGEHVGIRKPDAMSVAPTPIGSVPALHQPPGALLVELEKSPWEARVTRAIVEGVPTEVRGVLADVPVEVAVLCGECELCNIYDERCPEFYGTAYLSLNFNDYTTPPDFIGFRDRVLALPAILEIKREFERVVGPAKMCVTYDF